MKPHIKTYLKHFKYKIVEDVCCQACRSFGSIDIHHIKYRSQGGGDDIQNLIALCRPCHEKAHTRELSAAYLTHLQQQAIHCYKCKVTE